MRRLSAQFIFTNTGEPLKRGVITVGDDGRIQSVEDTNGLLRETSSVEFYNGIIIPGFVNCHCHLELSHLKNSIPRKSGLPEFIKMVRNGREVNAPEKEKSTSSADNEMFNEGIVLCADICNTSDTFNLKKKSRIRYINLLEVFGIDPEKAGKRMDEIFKVSEEATEAGLPWWFVPHSAYSVSLPLFRLLGRYSPENKITSIHFMESEAESEFLESHSGPIMDSYLESGLLQSRPDTVHSHESVVLEEINTPGTLILVHNTYVRKETIRNLKKRKNLFWCLCPVSNLNIEGRMPPLDILTGEDCEIVIGTDSLASNGRLSILNELKTLQSFFPDITLEKLVRFSTVNGARALGETGNYGTITTGKKPGLILLDNLDLINLRLLPGTTAARLI